MKKLRTVCAALVAACTLYIPICAQAAEPGWNHPVKKIESLFEKKKAAPVPLPQPKPLPPPRVYLMRGLLELSPFGTLKARLEAKGAKVSVWSWMHWREVVADAMRHRDDRIVIAGHSQGDHSAFEAGAALMAAGVPVKVIGLDPLCSWPQMAPSLKGHAVNIWGNWCGGRRVNVAGAHNIYLAGPSHIGYPADPRVQALFIREAFSN